MILWLLACGANPYPEYWPDKSAYPIIKQVEPSAIETRVGGTLVTIEGNRLSNTTTVTVGGRNAEIVSVDEHAVLIRVPPLPAGPEAVAVGVVTGSGVATRENALTVDSELESFWQDEAASVSILRYDCPIEAWGTYADGEQYPFGWCGPDMGYAAAEGWMGAGPQPGFAADIANIARLSEFPPVGETRIWSATDPAHPQPPLVFNAHGEREAIAIEAERDFGRDLAFIEERRELLEATYYWADGIVEWTGPFATLYDDEQCWVDELTVLSGDGNELVVDGDPTGATSASLGFGFVEDYGDELYEDWALTASATVRAADGRLIGGLTGPRLSYDPVSGWFLAQDGFAAGDIPSAEYTVTLTNAQGEARRLGRIDGPDPVDLWTTWPDLTLGDAVIDSSEDLVVEWTPAAATGGPTVFGVDIVIYDMDIANPNGPTPVGRLLAHGRDADGQMVIPAGDLERLPRAPNRWSEDDEQQGYWAEMTIVRHQLRRVGFADGDVVVDFIHAINSPVTITGP